MAVPLRTLCFLASLLVLGSAVAQEETLDLSEKRPHGRFVAVQMLSGLANQVGVLEERLSEVTSDLMNVKVLRRNLLATNDTNYEQNAIDAANARAAAAMAITPRVDPLNGMKKYTEGYDVTNMDYWASVVFTGVYGFALAIISLIVGIVYLLLKACCACCCSSRKKEVPEYSLMARTWPKALVLLFTLLAIAGAVVVYSGNGQLSTSLKSTTDDVITAVANLKVEVDQVAAALTNATEALDDKSGSSQIISSAQSLQTATTSVNLTVQKNKTKVYKYFDEVKLALVIVAAVVIGLSAAGLTLSILGLRPLLLLLFIIALIILFLTWLLFGITFALDNVITDTCMAMEQYTLDPANSTLGSLLPCVDPETATSALDNGKQAVKDLVKQVNNNIDQANQDQTAALALHPATHNNASQIPNLCDPYGASPNYAPATCPAGDGTLGTFQHTYAAYACSTDDSQSCAQANTPIKKSDFAKMINATGAAESVVVIMPALYDLVTCQFVNVTFTKVVTTDCSPLKTSLNLLWIGFVVVSVAYVFLEIVWMIVRTRASRGPSSSRVQHINDQPL